MWKALIVGAGPAGLATARNFKQHDIDFDIVERHSDLGGVWNWTAPGSPVYRSAHLISSKRRSEFPDFPMPDDYPDYPKHDLVLKYFRDYAKHFQLEGLIQFNRAVKKARKVAEDWDVEFADGDKRRYQALVLACGNEWHPSLPAYAQQFTGEGIHSSAYKVPMTFEGKRVLIIGAGNSGCDIAVEACSHATKTFLSLRRGYYFVPKYFLGTPADEFGELGLKLRLPLAIRRAIDTFLMNFVYGRPEKWGLPKPDHQLLESHPIVNSRICELVGQKDILPKPDVRDICGKRVTFRDGTEEEVDVIVYATGYHMLTPFLEGDQEFYLHLFSKRHDNLVTIGTIKPDSGVWWLCHEQAKLVAKYFSALKSKSPSTDYLRKLKLGPTPDLGNGIRYLDSARHKHEVEHSSYSRRLKKLLATIETT